MNRIMNNISTIVCNDLLEALEINFYKPGNLQEYNHSIQLALDLSMIHRINHWIIEKHDFTDIKVENFLMLIFSWAKIVCKRSKQHQQISIVTQSEMAEKIHSILHRSWWLNHYSRSDISFRPVTIPGKEKIYQDELLP